MPDDHPRRRAQRPEGALRAGRLLLALLTLGAPVRAVAAEPGAPASFLAVPFLPQTEALCGGAAAAMLFRYFGDRHADVEQFAPLVDRTRGGIAADRLVEAIAARGWRTTPSSGTLDGLRAELAQQHPPMLLIEDRPSRYHFVVAVGADAAHVYLHDPTWGPRRSMPIGEFARVWRVTANWMLTVAPGSPPVATAAPPIEAALSPVASAVRPASPATACDRAVDEAVDAVRAQGLDAADRIFGTLRTTCPTASRPLSELAGIRFAQQRYADAIELAGTAVDLDPHDAYAWDVLGSSRFVQRDVPGALAAWNVIGRPRLDLIRIEGLAHTRYAFVAQSLPLVPNAVVTADAYRLAQRRLGDLPGLTAAQLRLTPTEDGWAEVTAAVLERQSLPDNRLAWLTFGARTAVGRAISVEAPGWTGQSDRWTANWRWWNNRPRIAVGFAAPSAGRIRGVWQVDASWTRQAFASGAGQAGQRETQQHASLTLSDWIRPDLRYTVRGTVDSWQDDGITARGRTVGTGLALERHFGADRWIVSAEGRVWWPADANPAPLAVASRRFQSIDLQTAARSTTTDRGFVTLTTLGTRAVSAAAPRLLWPGAGDVDARSPMLRAHPLTRDGVIDSPAFGRRLVFASIEQRRWFNRSPILRVAVAGFIDAARAWQPADGDRRRRLVVDAGVGLRVRVPGHDDVLRVDYGHGLRDGAHVVSIGWAR